MNSQTPGMLRDTAHIFDLGLHRSRDKPFLGRRPVLSTNPLKFADHYVWETYGEVDVRRRAVGSALRKLFDTGYLKAENLDTVGIWSMNRPGMIIHILSPPVAEPSLQNGRSSTWLSRHTA
jgi:long-chain acyl-CoA synthetase